MAREIERKYLVTGDAWRNLRTESVSTIIQGYVPEDATVYISVREPDGLHIRICALGREATVVVPETPANKDFQAVFHLTGYDAQTTQLQLGNELILRVRSKTTNQSMSATLTIKQATEDPEIRTECETELLPEQAEYLLETVCGDYVSKTRHMVTCGGQEWAVDYFHGDLEGLVLAEVEVADSAAFDKLTLLPGAAENVTNMAGIDNRNLGRAGVPDAIRAKISV